ncbi:MAG: YihY/virulence factor BrkB family protein [Patescibacteria group bacterium]
MIDKVKKILREVFEEVQKNNIPDAAAALSFRALIAIVPSMAISIMVSGLVLGREKVLGWSLSFFEDILGTEVLILEKAVETTFNTMSGFIFSAVVLIISVWASVSLVDHVRRVFFKIFNLELRGTGAVRMTLKSRIFSSLYALMAFVLIIITILAQPLISLTFGFLGYLADEANLSFFQHFFRFVISFGVIVLIFALIYWFMSSGTLRFRSLLIGGVVSSVLFLVFNTLLSLYFSYSVTLTLFGASSFLVALLVWLNYFAFVLFLGGIIASVSEKRHNNRKSKKTVVYI